MSDERAVRLDSSFSGDSIHGRFSGRGAYRCSLGQYNGEFVEGAFHGQGALYLSNGRYEGLWENGVLKQGKFIFSDDLEYKDNLSLKWGYCSREDPRFHSEISGGLKLGHPLRKESPADLVPDIPFGCYDTIDGYFDPKKFAIFDYISNDQIRMPDKQEAAWIVENCRSNL